MDGLCLPGNLMNTAASFQENIQLSRSAGSAAHPPPRGYPHFQLSRSAGSIATPPNPQRNLGIFYETVHLSRSAGSAPLPPFQPPPPPAAENVI